MPRLLKITAPALLLVVVACAALLLALTFGGASDAPLIFDPGAVVRVGLPVATLLVNLSAAVTIGALVLVCFAMSNTLPEFDRALDVAAAAAIVWTFAAAAVSFLNFMQNYYKPISFDSRFGSVLSQFITTTGLGQAWLVTTLVAALVSVLCFAVRNRTALAFVAVFAALGLVPIALQGHQADAGGHAAAVSSLGLHIEFAAVWLGGLLTIVFIRPALSSGRIGPILARYSSLAIVCFVVVAISGYVNAALRVGTLSQLLTPYGILVIMKIFALLALGLFGLVQRKFLIAKLQRGDSSQSKFFWWLVSAELAFMGLASGVAVALARTGTPVPQTRVDDTPASILTGDALPPPLTAGRYLTTWNFDVLWVLVIAFLAFFYLAGVWRLRRRGDRWPAHRTLLWLAGLAVLFYATNGAVNVYEKYLISAHMLGHMIIGMMVPLLLVPAAPVTLALRALSKRADASRGPREWLMLIVHSPVAGVLTNPLVSAALFVGSLWAFYYTPLFSWATTDHVGHTWMVVHFLLTGFLFVQSMIGIDPVPRRAPYPFRLVILMATMAFHAFFGISLMTGTGLLLANWFGAMGRTWGASAIADQQTAGGIAWSVGEIPTVIMAIVVAILWNRSDERDAKRLDRKADRDGDTDLANYNDMLQRRSQRG